MYSAVLKINIYFEIS